MFSAGKLLLQRQKYKGHSERVSATAHCEVCQKGKYNTSLWFSSLPFPVRNLNNQAGVFRAASFTPPAIHDWGIKVEEEHSGFVSHLVLVWTLMLRSDLVVELPSFLGLLLVTHQWHVTSCLALKTVSRKGATLLLPEETNLVS